MSPLRDRAGAACALAALVLAAVSACSTDNPSSNPATLARDATANVACTDVSADCAQQYIRRASACAQLNTSTDARKNDEARRCAVQNFLEAERHAPAGASEVTRTDALIGLADAQKTLYDNAPDAQSAHDAQTQLDQTLSRLGRQDGGPPYVQYYAADRLVAQSNDPAMPDADACQRLHLARDSLPSGELNAQLAQRVTTLRNVLAFNFQRRRCT